MADDPPRRAGRPRSPSRARRPRPPDRLGERDLRVLEFAAEHPFLLNAHARMLLGSSTASASARLRNLTRGGWLRSERKLAGPGCVSDHPPWAWGDREHAAPAAQHRSGHLRPRRRDGVGVAGGQPRSVRSTARNGLRAPHALRGPPSCRGHRTVRYPPGRSRAVRGERRHYPDLLLETTTGHRVAVELELTPKARARRNEILGGYALDARVDAVLYLVEDRRTGLAIERAARRPVFGARPDPVRPLRPRVRRNRRWAGRRALDARPREAPREAAREGARGAGARSVSPSPRSRRAPYWTLRCLPACSRAVRLGGGCPDRCRGGPDRLVVVSRTWPQVEGPGGAGCGPGGARATTRRGGRSPSLRISSPPMP